LLDEKQKELTSDEIKKMIYKQIDKKQKQVDPTKHNMRIVENNLTELETMQFILSMIIDEEQLSKRNEPTIQQWNRIR
jgi:hypothetical protein